MKAILLQRICVFLCVFIPSFSYAQTQNHLPPTRVLLLLDASNSMANIWETQTRMQAAQKILIPFIDSLSKIPNLELALRIFGNRSPVPPQNCDDTHLEVPFSANNSAEIISKILETAPLGTTPIANSIMFGAEDFPEDSTYRNIMFIITDGVEACDGDPCAISRALQKKGTILKPFIIGVGNEIDWEKEYNCAGNVYSAHSEQEFYSILNYAMQTALTATPLQIYLMDTYKKPRETNVPMTFYDNHSGFVKYNFVHTLIQTGEPDILFIDPLVSYSIKVHTKPPVFSDTINLEAGKHTIVEIDAPQGYIQINHRMGQANSLETPAIVRKSKTMETLHIQKPGECVKYITGMYDLEVLTLPRTFFYDVKVRQSEITKLTIPRSGRVTFTRPTPAGYGSIFIDRNTDLELVVEMVELTHNEETFFLQPGKYVVVWRAKNETDTEKSISKRFEVKEGSSQFIRLR
ncbi:MAG: VWA domain-containing protein [Bacteroidales bacterium]|nr:VWA domain-containing protein [Bacteroidales bacterium]NLK81588.1 VWA domain-containing protein [Bacteroidales bacterium]HPY81734.1 VWA domain-containing protein [Bacteroidales bacterium]